jgi:hypothetical protein
MPRCEQDSTNGRRPPAVPGIAPLYSGRRFDPRRQLTLYERTLHAVTARACTLCVHGQVLETGFSAYGNCVCATPALRPLSVHMAWDLES